MKITTYVWDNIGDATKELEARLNEGFEIVSSKIYEVETGVEESELIFAAVLVKEVK